MFVFTQLPEHVRRAAMEASSDDDSDEDGEGEGNFSAGWGKNRRVLLNAVFFFSLFDAHDLILEEWRNRFLCVWCRCCFCWLFVYRLL